MNEFRQSVQPSALIIIPVFNEAVNLGPLLEKLLRITRFDVIVVDDCSADRSVEIALQSGVSVLPLSARLGAWGAVQTGIRYGIHHNYDYFITMDGDGQHHPSDLVSLVEELGNGTFDMVVGSCPSRGSVARHVAWWIFRQLSGLKLKDLTSGFKAFNRKTADCLVQPEACLFDYQDVGVMLYLSQKNIVTTEKCVSMSPRGDGKSRIFHSWFHVTKYMLQTIVLCLSMHIFKYPRLNKS